MGGCDWVWVVVTGCGWVGKMVKPELIHEHVKELINHAHYMFFCFFEWGTLEMFLLKKKRCQPLYERFRTFSIKQ